MKKVYVITLLAFVSLHAFSQEALKKYITTSTHPIHSIQPDDMDFADLEVIGQSIGDSRVVMLGEQNHGDGATFLAKSRLVKYLHEKKGFNVLAFENDFFALNSGWDLVEKEQQQITTYLNDNIYSIWSHSMQCSDLFYNYIPGTFQSHTPLTVTGFDSQVYMDYSPRNLQDFVHNYLKQKNIPFTQTEEYQVKFLPAIGGLTKGWLAKGKEQELLELEERAGIVLQQLGKYKNEYEWLLIKNIQSFAASTRLAKDVEKALEIRDKQMAENLEWVLRVKFPNEKVIVWAANAHIAKNATTAFKFERSRRKWMGTVFTSNSQNNVNTYVIGFSSKNGSQKRIHEASPSLVSRPLKHGFENWVSDKHSYAFIDFKRFRKENPSFSKQFAMKGIGHSSDIADWTSVFDGIFFIKEMTPSEKIEKDLGSTNPIR
ncbi:erythromycin esterase family protein [Pontibacter vulgaris]|uniref:erythromycin esterase family protein n=1 Tax=Pontibacter vulgaris TaxID=2905679 RepID=UPI001FA7B11A|nr:erythromycin esterase family protein [Pontibacter vulgaris]